MNISNFGIIIFITAFVVNIGCVVALDKNKFVWHSIKVPYLSDEWKIEESDERKLLLSCSGFNDRPIIYLEYVNIPKNRSLTMDEYTAWLIENYRNIYDDISIQEIFINGIKCNKIIHIINNDNRKLNTLIIPKESDFITIVFSASKESFKKLEQTFVRFRNSMEFK